MLFLDVEFILSLIVLLLPLHYYICISALSQGNDLLNGDDIASPSVDDISHAFVQTDSELHYFRDVSHREILLSSISELGERFDSKKQARNIALFETDFTDFETSSIGVPVSQKIFVINPTNSKVVFTAITIQAINFHCSFIEKRILEPKQKTSFEVLFLPTREGIVQDLVILHSSVGKFLHKVVGKAVDNPYRVQPFLGVRLPLNATFKSEITIHNPHNSVLKVVEVFSSDANVHVELPGMDLYARSGKSILWEIAPYETKSIAIVNVLGNVERNFTSFLYINMHTKKQLLETEKEQLSANLSLVIPLEVQVSKRRGIFSSDSALHFGLIKEGERSKQLTFRVYSNLEKGVDIETIYVSKSINQVHGVYMQFATKPPISLKCGARNQPGAEVAIAKINIDSSISIQKDDSTRLYNRQGTIVAESRGGNFNISVPYKAQIYRGELLHNPEDVAFHYKLIPIVNRGVLLTNNFPFGLAIWNVSLDEGGRETFEVRLVSPVVLLAPSQTLPVLLLRYLRQQLTNFTTHCTVHTNITSFDIPIVVFDGKLEIKLNSLSQNKMDFGTVRIGDHRSILLTVENKNPVQITLRKLDHPLSMITSLQIMYNLFNTSTDSALRNSAAVSSWVSGSDFVLSANSFVVFNYTLLAAPNIQSEVADDPEGRLLQENFVMRTDFDEFQFPVSFELSTSYLVAVPETISFKDCYIGTVHSSNIKVYSTFEESMPVLRLSIANNDSRFHFAKLSLVNNESSINPVIGSKRVSNLLKIMFVPEDICKTSSASNECYVGIPLNTPDGQWFAYGLKLPQNLAEIDSYLYTRLRRKWKMLASRKVNTTVLLDTSRVKNFEIPVEAELTWPKLLSHSVVHFPLTALGNFTIVNLTLHNPSTRPVIVQLLPLVIYPDAESMLEFFREEFPAPLTEPVEMNETLMFSLRDTELFTLKPGSPVPKLREELETVVGGQVPRFTLSMILQPGMKTRVRLGFLPSDYVLRSSLLLIRNNLTGLEPVVLYGQGAQIRMEIDNKTARSQPLLFEIQSNHLSDCYNPKRLMHKLPTTLTVKRSFIVKNTGEVTFSVVNMSINNVPCENRGFRILNCHSFRLDPGEINLLDIAYTPDFLMSINEASLQIYMHMNGTPWIFDLTATIPKHMLSMCHSALPRPPFEGVMYYSCVFALLFCLICVIACSYLEGDRITTCAIRQQFVQERKVFDLNSAPPTTTPCAAAAKTKDSKPTSTPTQQKQFGLKLPKRLRYKDYMNIPPDSNLPSQLFWRSVNCVLWLFSHVWLMFREDGAAETTPRPSSNNQRWARKKKGVAVLEEVKSKGVLASDLAEDYLPTVKQGKQEQKFRKLSNASGSHKSNGDLTSHFSSSFNDSSPAPLKDKNKPLKVVQVSEENSDNLEMELRLRRKLQMMDCEEGSSRVNQLETQNGANKKKLSKILMVEQKLGKISQESPKESPVDGTPGKVLESASDQLLRSVSSSSSSVAAVKPNTTNQKKASKQKGKKGGSSSSPFSQSIDSTISQSSSAPVVTTKEILEKEIVLVENAKPEKEIIKSSKNEDISSLSDGSEVPEWVETTLVSGNVDEDFDALASHSAALFSEKDSPRTESPVSSSSRTSFSFYNVPANVQRFDRTPKKPSTFLTLNPLNEDNQLRTSKRKKKNMKQQIVEDPEIKRYIGQLTREYRERLKQAIASGLPLSDGLLRGKAPKMPLTLPADLSADNWNWLLTSDDSTEEVLEEQPMTSNGWPSISLQPAIGSGQPALASTPSPPVQSSSSTQASANFYAIVGGEEAKPPNPPSPLQFDSLFNSGNPIWKPIFEDIPSSYWPSGFDIAGEGKSKKE